MRSSTLLRIMTNLLKTQTQNKTGNSAGSDLLWLQGETLTHPYEVTGQSSEQTARQIKAFSRNGATATASLEATSKKQSIGINVTPVASVSPVGTPSVPSTPTSGTAKTSRFSFFYSSTPSPSAASSAGASAPGAAFAGVSSSVKAGAAGTVDSREVSATAAPGLLSSYHIDTQRESAASGIGVASVDARNRNTWQHPSSPLSPASTTVSSQLSTDAAAAVGGFGLDEQRKPERKSIVGSIAKRLNFFRTKSSKEKNRGGNLSIPGSPTAAGSPTVAGVSGPALGARGAIDGDGVLDADSDWTGSERDAAVSSDKNSNFDSYSDQSLADEIATSCLFLELSDPLKFLCDGFKELQCCRQLLKVISQ